MTKYLCFLVPVLAFLAVPAEAASFNATKTVSCWWMYKTCERKVTALELAFSHNPNLTRSDKFTPTNSLCREKYWLAEDTGAWPVTPDGISATCTP